LVRIQPPLPISPDTNFEHIFDRAPLGPSVRALALLSPKSQEIAISLIRQLAEGEGISIAPTATPGLQTPAEGIPLWIAKLKQESFSRRTIDLYLLTVKNYLERDPMPTKLSIQRYLAERLETVSTARASNDRKALRSLFSFLHQEGLWPTDPTAGLKHIRVRYRAREVPEAEDLAKLFTYECYRQADTDKFQAMLTILVATGLRVSEAAGIRKKSINLRLHELKVVGKGDKEGIVPLLPTAERAVAAYMEKYPNDSPFLFPGDTGDGHWSIHSFERTLARACGKLGVRRITPHQLRHFFATYALKGGAKLEVVSKILRHASVGITADIYRHVLTDELHEMVERFAPLAGQGSLALSQAESMGI
jgi:integrase/recombinase XerD